MKDTVRNLTELDRREFLSRTAAASLGVTILPHLASGAEALKPSSTATAKNVIFLYMAGGMPHVDTFDPKTASDVKGNTTPLSTNADGVQISSLLPKMAAQADKFAVVRSMSTKTGDHSGGNYLMHTGYARRPGITHPQMGSWAQHFLGRRAKLVPDSVVIGAGNPGPGFFRPDHSPLPIGDPSKGIKDLVPKIDKSRFERRMRYAETFSKAFEEGFPHDDVSSYADFYDETVKLFDSKTTELFDINKEPANIKGLYGNSRFGRGLLLARRLIENDVRYAEVQLGGWDGMHGSLNVGNARTNQMDGPIAALLQDLESRGLLQETLVVVTTEFGRTPKVNGRGGRDHFPKAFSIMLAGGGIRGGQVIGKTDERASNIETERYGPKDLHSTIAHALGLPLQERVHAAGGRPFFVGNRGKVIKGAFA
ncbi:MAG: DUF1501 domain-containing protein [Akkermansiaceae bacterium]|jgi:hypothetical protein|nr:DUF1501 domain-containing protein [Roseibacillus sp.]